MCIFSEANRKKLGNAVTFIAQKAKYPYKTEVLKHMGEDLMMASLPTSQDHVPGDLSGHEPQNLCEGHHSGHSLDPN